MRSAEERPISPKASPHLHLDRGQLSAGSQGASNARALIDGLACVQNFAHLVPEGPFIFYQQDGLVPAVYAVRPCLGVHHLNRLAEQRQVDTERSAAAALAPHYDAAPVLPYAAVHAGKA